MRVTARTEYALRALLALSAADPQPRTANQLADTQRIPLAFLQVILGDLRRSGLVHNHRGYRLRRPAADITVGEVVRTMDGPPQAGTDRSEDEPGEPVATLRLVWLAADAALVSVIDAVTVADLSEHRLPAHVRALISQRPER